MHIMHSFAHRMAKFPFLFKFCVTLFRLLMLLLNLLSCPYNNKLYTRERTNGRHQQVFNAYRKNIIPIPFHSCLNVLHINKNNNIMIRDKIFRFSSMHTESNENIQVRIRHLRFVIMHFIEMSDEFV